MKKRILTLLAAVCLLSAVLSGCGGGSQNGTTGTTDQSTANTQTEGPAARAAAGELNVGIAQDLDSSLDPHKTVKAGTREVMFNVFEGLFEARRQRQPESRCGRELYRFRRPSAVYL